MRKVFVFTVLAAIAFSTTSCRKSYRCVCRYVYTGGDYTTIAVANSTKRDANEWCSAIQKSENQPGVTTTCKLE